MSVAAKISPYRMGEPRFGQKTDGWKPTLNEYKLTPEELTLYLNKEKTIDEILADRKEKEKMPKKLDVSVEEYVIHKNKGLKDKEIAEKLGLTVKQLMNWKYQNKDQIKIELNKTNEDIKVYKLKYSELLQANDKLIKENSDLKSENTKLIEENKKLIQVNYDKNQELEVNHSKIIDLENKLENAAKEIRKLHNQLENYSNEYNRVEKEVKALRLYALEKLNQDVYTH